MTASDSLSVAAGPPDPRAFDAFGAFVEPPTVGGRAHFEEWLQPVSGLAASYHLNRVAPSTFPVTLDRVERHPYAAQLFLPVGVERYLVTVMPPGATGAPDPRAARAFVVPGTMGVVYRPGTWHAGIVALDAEGSFAVMMWRGADRDDDFADLPALTVTCEPGAP